MTLAVGGTLNTNTTTTGSCVAGTKRKRNVRVAMQKALLISLISVNGFWLYGLAFFKMCLMVMIK